MNNKFRVAAYCRVNTNMDEQLHSLSAQIKYFTDYNLIEVYYDKGITGTFTKKRDGFKRMISNCKKGKIDLILTKEVSRFARNTIDTLTYTRQLKAYNVHIVFMNDGIDTRDKDSELRLTIMASLAQEESRKISERTKWGMRRKIENGYVLGRGRICGFKATSLKLFPKKRRLYGVFFNRIFMKKGTTLIAQELNADKISTLQGDCGALRQF